MENYHGFEMIKRYVNDREFTIVIPEKGTENGHWVLKTEYFDAFPEVELKLVKEGYHIAHVKNISRWNPPEDTEARVMLAEYMHSEFKLNKKCAIVGMSCGGMQGIYFAAEYPEYVSCMYLDAPVVNLLSNPADLGCGKSGLFDEFYSHRGISIQELISYRNHPLDKIPDLVKNKIPIILVSGDCDALVPYEENGLLLETEYKKNGCIIETIIKKGAGHHPHGLDENDVIVDFIKKYDV